METLWLMILGYQWRYTAGAGTICGTKVAASEWWIWLVILENDVDPVVTLFRKLVVGLTKLVCDHGVIGGSSCRRMFARRWRPGRSATM